jgi:tetratricopeptide (TPR) repeat protein
VKRTRLWVGLTATTAAVATGVTLWAMQSQSTAPPESKAASVTRKAQQTKELLQAAIQQQYRDPKEAASTYRRVLELDPRNTLALFNLGAIAQQYGRMAEARAAYDKTLKIDPKFTSALFNEGVLLRSSEPDRAIELLRRAIAANPTLAAGAHLQLGEILVEKDRHDAAKEEFRHAVAADPSLLSRVPQRFRDAVNPSPTSSQEGSPR